MENKKVGMLVVGIAFAVGVIVWTFNSLTQKVIDETCTMGINCVMHETANTQLGIGFGIVLVIAVIGFYIMFSKPDEKIVVKKVKEKISKKKLDLSNLEKDEKKVVNLLVGEGKAMFQRSLMEKMEIGKVKMTRLLDKLEAKQFIIRKRRGMNNIVVLKD